MNDLRKNGSGYYDPVAYSAMRGYKYNNAGMQVYRGDVFYLTGTSGEVVGSEQNESRPCVIVSNNTGNRYSNIVEIVLLSTKNKHNLPTHCTVLAKIPSIALCEQIKSVSKARLGEWTRKCTDEEMDAIDKCLAISIGLHHKPGTNDELTSLKTERDLYKEMYDQLIERITL